MRAALTSVTGCTGCTHQYPERWLARGRHSVGICPGIEFPASVIVDSVRAELPLRGVSDFPLVN